MDDEEQQYNSSEAAGAMQEKVKKIQKDTELSKIQMEVRIGVRATAR
jgi:hypothetical protein